MRWSWLLLLLVVCCLVVVVAVAGATNQQQQQDEATLPRCKDGLCQTLGGTDDIAEREPGWPQGQTFRILAVEKGKEYGPLVVLDDLERGWRVLVSRNSLIGGEWHTDPPQNIFSVFHVMAALRFLLSPSPTNNLLQIGVGIGSTAKSLEAAGVVSHMDVVDINPVVLQYAREFFGFRGGGSAGGEFAMDGRLFLEQASQRDLRYDAILHDVFEGGSTASHLLTQETFRTIRDLLRPPNGVLVLNFFGFAKGTKRQMSATWSIFRTLRSVFPHVRCFVDQPLDRVPQTKEGSAKYLVANLVFFASEHNIQFNLPDDVKSWKSVGEDAYWIWNHFEEWELPMEEAAQESDGAHLITDEHNPMDKLQQVITTAFLKEYKSYVPAPVREFMNSLR